MWWAVFVVGRIALCVAPVVPVNATDKESVMAKNHFVTEGQLIVMGRRYGSGEIALEVNEALARWRRDVGALGGYGLGQAALDAFAADAEAHAKMRAARPDAVSDKKMAVVTRDKHVSAAWAWVDRVGSMLGVLARTDQTLAMALASALPQDDAGLESGIRSLRTILFECKDRLPAEALVDRRLNEVDGLCAALREAIGVVHTSRSQTQADTTQIDLYDGKLYLAMCDLNSAGRKAIRNGDLHAKLHEYTLHHLKRSGSPNPAPVVPPANTSSPTG
jgi:hypothetical protein